jgi:carbamoyltransferase
MIILGYSGFTRDSRLPGGLKRHAATNITFDNLFEFRGDEAPFTMSTLSYFGHDAAAALIHDGKIISCAAEERFTRAKHSLNLVGNTLLPKNAIWYCLQDAGISIHNVDIVAHYCNFTDESILKRLELLHSSVRPVDVDGLRESYFKIYESMLCRESTLSQFEAITGERPQSFLPVGHHEAHAASAFFCSGFSEALILTLDGSGELESSIIALGRGSRIEEIRRTYLPTSLGALYLIVTVYLGFRSLGDEYKVMGLAAYGNPATYRACFESLITLEEDGQYLTPGLAQKGLQEFLLRRLGAPRKPWEPIEGKHADIAAALQEALCRTVLHLLRHARAHTKVRRLCMAGGVALNCSLTGAIARSGLFDDIFVQPASSDEGGSLGAALFAFHGGSDAATNDRLMHASFGPLFEPDEIHRALRKYEDKLIWSFRDDIESAAAEELSRGKVVGWFQGRMEFGPRALGNRSILADPRDPNMKDRINKQIKRREAFRPFAPAILEEEAGNYFDMTGLSSSPFMLFAVPVKREKINIIPAVTHVDGTARVQTVSRDDNPAFWNLISKFKRLAGIPVVLNTSFNVRNEPIVCSPTDALKCFLATDIDCLGIGPFFVRKRITGGALP